MAGSTMVSWIYTTDDGHSYERKARADYTTQVVTDVPKIGGAAADAYYPKMPRSFKPRVAVCEDADHNRYRVVCYDPTALLYVTPTTSFDIFAKNGGSTIAVTSREAEGERKRGYRFP